MTEPATHYRGIPIPNRLQRYYTKPTGRWWKNGVDDTFTELIAVISERIEELTAQKTFNDFEENRVYGRIVELEDLLDIFTYIRDDSK
jgi:hypothetical protein